MRAAVLDDLPATPATHFRLHFYAAVLEAAREAAHRFGSMEGMLDRHSCLAAYLNELAERGLEGGTLDEAGGWWRLALERWEQSVSVRLPLRDLARAAALDHESLTLLVGAGVAEEDARLGALFEGLGGRPQAGMLTGWFEALEAGGVRTRIRRLVDLGLLRACNPEAPFPGWSLEVPPLLWEAMRGEPPAIGAGWARLRKAVDAKPLDELCLADAVAEQAGRVATLLADRRLDGVVVRGPHHNGRRSLLAAVARAAGRDLLEIDAARKEVPSEWKLVGPLALLLDAMPALVFDPGPGEVVQLPELTCGCGPVGVVLGPRGAIAGIEGLRVVEIDLALPDAAMRRRLWAIAALRSDEEALDALATGFRMTSGNICHLAALASSHALMHGRARPAVGDVQAGARALDRAALETLAARLPANGDWNNLVLSADTRAELWTLEARCRHRERLPQLIGEAPAAQVNPGVRALLRGPSGTGKTLAARVLAAALSKDLYRIDLSTVVNKYIGETEKNLERALSCAEELDVILLFDEGDALLAQRTGVSGANDRYANLETNFLLQRIESFQGILLITTNLAEQIDRAFQRRIDVVVDFRLPEADERASILHLHLPADHQVSAVLLEEAAHRCALSGGQIRNAVLHASLLALGGAEPLSDRHLEAAIQREYRKAGAVCPLRVPRRAAIAAA